MKVLIVDDKEESIYLLETLLKGNGFEVLSAGNGVEALELLKKEPVGLIVSDILMPKMDGFQLCRSVKRDDALHAIPFIFYTASYTDEKDEELALKMGAEKFIRKPAEPEEFIRIIRGVIGDAQGERTISKKSVSAEEEEVLKLYNERLITKLEQKMIDLEKEMADRKKLERELQKRIRELEDFYEIAIGRELKMIELKKELKELKNELEKCKKAEIFFKQP